MKFSPRQIGIIAAGLVAVVVIFYLLVSNLKSKNALPEIELTMWGTESSEDMSGVIGMYESVRTNVKIKYQRVQEDEYGKKLLNALASGKGPDIYFVGSNDIPKEAQRLIPADISQINLTKVRELFPTVVEQDFVKDGQVYALPLYIDTLALIYNKDIFDSAGITAPPKTWTEFQEQIIKLRVINEGGQISQAGAAVGGSEASVKNAVSLLYALMLQNGAQMTDATKSSSAFSSASGLEALNFYIRFANSASSYYTWNEAMGSDMNMFAEGKVAMVLGYKSDVDAIKKKSPFLNIGTATLPQLQSSGKQITSPNYLGLAVSRLSSNSSWAWDFIIFATANDLTHKSYLEKTGRPPALRSVISSMSNNSDLGVYAKQSLTARSWYQADADAIGDIFNSAIVNVLQGRMDTSKALRTAKEQVDLEIKKLKNEEN